MSVITSADNQIYRSFTRLYRRKYRDREGLYVIEGENLILEAASNGAVIDKVFIREGSRYDGLTEEITGGAPVYTLSPGLFDRAADTETPQGVAAVLKKPQCSREAFFRETDNIIVLDRLQDPGNLGTILRTADAAGYKGVLVIKGTADLFSPKTVRAAAGSLQRVRLLYADGPGDACSMLRAEGRRIICTSPYAEHVIYDVDISSGAALVIGNEAGGVCSELLENADTSVKLPMEGSIESLNAAIAASVVMYESVRQRYAGRQAHNRLTTDRKDHL